MILPEVSCRPTVCDSLNFFEPQLFISTLFGICMTFCQHFVYLLTIYLVQSKGVRYFDIAMDSYLTAHN